MLGNQELFFHNKFWSDEHASCTDFPGLNVVGGTKTMQIKISGFMMLAAVFAIGFAGSQYTQSGGLSGQAAGGDAAGCGGDSYYDEDLQAMVGGDGSAVASESSSLRSTDTTQGSLVLREGITGVAFGEPMEGQPLLRLFEPSPAAVQRLVELSNDQAEFQASVDIANDGSFATVAFFAPGYPQVTEVLVLENIGSKWLAYPIVQLDDGQPLKFQMVEVIDVVNGELGAEVVVLLNKRDYLRLVPSSGTLYLETRDVTNDRIHAQARAAGSIEIYTAQLRSMETARSVVAKRVKHPWLYALIDKFFDGADFEISVAVTNEMLVPLKGGTVISVEGCQFGSEPRFNGPELVCDTCASDDVCDNPFNRRNLFDVSIAERDGTIEGLEL